MHGPRRQSEKCAVPIVKPCLIIGDTPVGLQEYFNRCIDEVAIYSYVLTPDQIAAHFDAAQ